MKRTVPIVLSILAISITAFAQAPDDAVQKALMAAPRQLKDGAAVIKWKPDFTYETLKKGTNRTVCYDLSGWPGHPPFMIGMHQHGQPGSRGTEPEIRSDGRQESRSSGAGRRRERRNAREARVRIGLVST